MWPGDVGGGRVLTHLAIRQVGPAEGAEEVPARLVVRPPLAENRVEGVVVRATCPTPAPVVLDGYPLRRAAADGIDLAPGVVEEDVGARREHGRIGPASRLRRSRDR